MEGNYKSTNKINDLNSLAIANEFKKLIHIQIHRAFYQTVGCYYRKYKKAHTKLKYSESTIYNMVITKLKNT